MQVISFKFLLINFCVAVCVSMVYFALFGRPERLKLNGWRYYEEVKKDDGSGASAMGAPHVHVKCRNKRYDSADGGAERIIFPDDKVPWDTELDYHPVKYTINHILTKKPVWADPDELNAAFKDIKFNQIDGKTNRVSFMGNYEIVDGLPRNPRGRTGLAGRGQLGKWGPNHAADPIVTRWKRDSKGNKERIKDKDGKKKPILEFVTIQRRDTKEWAIPGGMVDAGEQISLTLKREFGEEALNSIEEEEKEETRAHIEELFSKGEVIYKGYVDDPRNTDNAWMETVAVNFHDDDGTTVGKIPLSAGDDAQAVQWHPIDGELSLYASHADFIKTTCERRGAYFFY